MLTKQRLFEIINKADEGDKASRLFDGIIMSLICLSIVSIVLESFSSLAQNYRLLFRIFEGVSVAIFTIEYICRIWTADLLYPNEKHPRLKYVTSFMAIIDLLAILPFFIPFVSVDLRFLRMVRLLRLSVAITRAKRQVWLSYSGSPSELIERYIAN